MDGGDRPRAHRPPRDVLRRPRKEYERAQSGIKKGRKARALRPAPAPPLPTSICLFIYFISHSPLCLAPALDSYRQTATAGRCSSSLLLLRPYHQPGSVRVLRPPLEFVVSGGGGGRHGRGFAPRGSLPPSPAPSTVLHARLCALSTLF
jgi:hypothetical protein